MASAAETASISYQSALEAYEAGDAANALVYAKLAGAGGDKDAQALVGVILMSGDVGQVDPVEAAKWFLKAAQQGQEDAMIELGKLGLHNQGGLGPADALNWLSRAAKLGRTDAMRALADMYILGKGTPPNPQAGRNWLRTAANNGDVLAMRALGDLELQTNSNAALGWYEKAAEMGDQDSAYIAGIMYVENIDIKPDPVKSAQYLGRAAQAGHPAAQADYGLLVFQGYGVKKSLEEAAHWFEKSAKNGDPEGRFLYAFTLAKGEGVSQSYEEAYYWLIRADEETGKTGINEYDSDRAELRERLEKNVDPAVLERARKRANSDRLLSVK